MSEIPLFSFTSAVFLRVFGRGMTYLGARVDGKDMET